MFLSTPLLGILFVLSATLFFVLIVPRTTERLRSVRVVCLWGSLFALAIGILMGLTFDKAAVGYQYMSSASYISEYNTSFALGVDGISYVFLVLTLFTFPFLFLAAWNVNKFPHHFLAHLLAMEILLVLTFVTVDLFYFFVLFESLLIPMFILIGGWGARTRKVKAAYYFFLYTLFGSLFMLFGMIYLYHITGSLNYYVVLNETIDAGTQNILWGCFFLAFAVKMPLFPFHIWLPEAHVEAPTVGSMLLASLLLKLGGYGLIRFSLTFLGDASIHFTSVVAALSVAGVIYGSLSTMRQIDLKRIIAYSSVAHMNLVALGIFSFSRAGLEGSIYLMVAHGVVSAALFFCVGVIYDRTHTRLLRYYGGVSSVMPLYSSYFFVFNLANMGFPGTPNFVGELLVFVGLLIIAPELLAAALSSVVFSAAYGTMLHARVCAGTLKTQFIKQHVDTDRREAVILGGFAAVALALALRTDFLIAYLESAVWIISQYGASGITVAGCACFVFNRKSGSAQERGTSCTRAASFWGVWAVLKETDLSLVDILFVWFYGSTHLYASYLVLVAFLLISRIGYILKTEPEKDPAAVRSVTLIMRYLRLHVGCLFFVMAPITAFSAAIEHALNRIDGRSTAAAWSDLSTLSRCVEYIDSLVIALHVVTIIASVYVAISTTTPHDDFGLEPTTPFQWFDQAVANIKSRIPMPDYGWADIGRTFRYFFSRRFPVNDTPFANQVRAVFLWGLRQRQVLLWLRSNWSLEAWAQDFWWNTQRNFARFIATSIDNAEEFYMEAHFTRKSLPFFMLALALNLTGLRWLSLCFYYFLRLVDFISRWISRL